MPSIWKGSIAFGLINVPVELRRAVKDHRISFRMLHERSSSPIRYKRVREDTGQEVPWAEIVKGYEAEKGEFIVLTDKDFKDAAVEQTNLIEITDFIDDGDIDPRFYESAYFLVAGKGGGRAYALLRDAMAKTNRAAIGKIIVHQRQHIAEVRADGRALVLMMLRFADELIAADEYEFPPALRGSAREAKMATELVKSLQGGFEPAKYADEYDANLRRIIKAKSKGKRVTLVGAERDAPEPTVLDLMQRLKDSLKENEKKAPARARKRKSA